MSEFATFIQDGDFIVDNGTRVGTIEIIRECLPEAAIIPVDEVPGNWRDMTVQDGRLVLASAEVLDVRRTAENVRKAEILRTERDCQLAATDKYMIPDYPISEQQREQYRAYRQYLRDLPESDGFPDVPVMNFEEFLDGR